MNDDDGLPVVRAALGDSLVDVRERSTHRFNFDRLDDYDLVGSDTLLRFVYAGPRPFDLAPTRFFTLGCTAALVCDIAVSPHTDYLSQPQALALADDLLLRIERAGWTNLPTDLHVTGREELLLRLRDPAGSDDKRWYVGSFASESARVKLRLRRAHRAGRMAEYDLFLLRVEIRDDVLRARADEVMRVLAAADGAPADGARRIALDSYVPRVRQLIPR